MLGHTLFHDLGRDFEVYGTVRSASQDPKLIGGISIEGLKPEQLEKVDQTILKLRPDVVMNCISLIRRSEQTHKDQFIEANSLWPHKLSDLCLKHKTRLIHFSSDGVFSGNRNDRKEDDIPDGRDLNGLTKLLGEVEGDHALNLRLSIIGHELGTSHHLLEWFLKQEESCTGFRQVLYSGLPTIIVSEILRHHILKSHLMGIYHLSSFEISKYDLLKKVAHVYGKKIEIIPNDVAKLNRGLNSEKFQAQTGYKPESWDVMIQKMHEYYINSSLYKK